MWVQAREQSNSCRLPSQPSALHSLDARHNWGSTQNAIHTSPAYLAAQRLELLDAVGEGNDLGGAHKAAEQKG